MTSRPARYPLAIIGAGALGLHFAARLAARGPVAVVARSAVRAAALRAGVRVGNADFQPDAFGPDRLPEADWVIILVKAGDTADAARTALALRPRGVLSLQNGLVENVLCEACGALPVGQGITTEGAFRDADRVVPSGAGDTLLPPGFEAVADLLVAAGLRARVEPDIVAARLAKLLVNVAINPLAALFRVPNGALLEMPHRALLDALVAEAWPVLRAAGLQLDEAAARERVIAVATATAANRASMLQDVLAGRRTEIDAITGALLAMAEAQGVDLPTHRAMFAQVTRLWVGLQSDITV
ncbi:MAG: 2-dehydropantoate 2-reductase [Zoogloea sp.]|nr:2-dehydropantoate 2-reductase [Zoogloea sp.]